MADLKIRIWRGDETGGAMADFSVPARENQTILDVVTQIQREQIGRAHV